VSTAIWRGGKTPVPQIRPNYGRKRSKDAAIGRHQEEMEYREYRGFGLKYSQR